MSNYATLQDVTTMYRTLTLEEQAKATQLLSDVSNILRYEAEKVGKNLDTMVSESDTLAEVVKSVTVDIVVRSMPAPNDSSSLSQFSQSVGGYSISGTYANGGGGIFVKKSELSRIGLKRERVGVIEFYG